MKTINKIGPQTIYRLIKIILLEYYFTKWMLPIFFIIYLPFIYLFIFYANLRMQ